MFYLGFVIARLGGNGRGEGKGRTLRYKNMESTNYITFKNSRSSFFYKPARAVIAIGIHSFQGQSREYTDFTCAISVVKDVRYHLGDAVFPNILYQLNGWVFERCRQWKTSWKSDSIRQRSAFGSFADGKREGLHLMCEWTTATTRLIKS